ncbi:MAG TPA: lytic murein transglycosylase B [Gammaproteobacteria bacterium]|nr:lytic murein transglycosylase B [Gammaproteobacteria bacterium]
MKIIPEVVLVFSIVLMNPAQAAGLDQVAVDRFINEMVREHDFVRSDLENLFENARKSQRVLDAIQRPAEALPWHEYRQIFIKPARIEQGIRFWEENREALDRARRIYGVPPEIIIAIIGVETSYGRFTGSDRVIDALATLAFHYPRRGAFFRDQLKQYLILAREQKIDPLSFKGSYAGAMGIPQFIPSSYRSYAVDFDRDGKIDIWNDPVDAIGSVANYFHEHQWVKDDPIAMPATVDGDEHLQVLNDRLELHMQAAELPRYGIRQSGPVTPDRKLKLLRLDTAEGNEYWLAMNNFYVITRYNHSALYAMAVYQLSEEIRSRMENHIATIE